MTERLPSSLVEKSSVWLFFLLFLLLPSQFGKHFWPPFSFVLGERIDYLSPTIFVTDIIVAALLLAQIIQKKTIVSKKMLLTAFFLPSVLVSSSLFGSSYSFVKMLEYVLLFYVIVSFSGNLRKQLVIALCVGIVGESMLSFLQFDLQSSIGSIAYFFGERTFSGTTPGIANAAINGRLILRPYGTFSHPNVLAGFLLTALCMIAQYAQVFKNKFVKPLVIVVVAIGSIGIFLTLSRVAILLWIVFAVLFFVFYLFPKRKKIAVFALAILAAIIAVVAVGSGFIGRFTSLSLTDESIVERQVLVSASISMWRDHALFGVGLGNFLRILPSYESPQTLPYVLQPVHNIFLLVATETGLLGLFGFALFLGGIVRKIASSYRQYLFLSLSFVSILVIGMFDHYFLTLQQGQLILTIVSAFIYKEM